MCVAPWNDSRAGTGWLPASDLLFEDAEAEGEAQRLRSDGLAAKRSRVELARGRSARFAALAREHERAPAVTEQRLYLEAIDRILPNVETYVVEPGRAGNVNLRIVR